MSFIRYPAHKGRLTVKARTRAGAEQQIRDELFKFYGEEYSPPFEMEARAFTMDMSTQSGPNTVVAYWDVTATWL
jgi:hypothetical protein